MASVNNGGQDSDLLWQQPSHYVGGSACTNMQNNLPVASSNGGLNGVALAASMASDVQSRQSWHKNVVVQQAEVNGSGGSGGSKEIRE